ncbi:MAG: hypothetical protein K2J84_05365 [Bacteroidaceae bacterium]|nr:hypothetical protein [Bacteroidaceae bacterium]
MLDKKLRNLIILFNENSLITLSWGISEIQEHASGVVFLVKGLKYQGTVLIEEINGIYSINVGGEIHTTTYSNLIQTIDNIVES